MEEGDQKEKKSPLVHLSSDPVVSNAAVGVRGKKRGGGGKKNLFSIPHQVLIIPPRGRKQ